ncbi:hypothetical protein ACFCX0_44910 [Streptomyces sp. NPDC056352]|uniref:hypothetical protein n=1 Tax=Streptomyces sp. NPDC056352 TaxID=3345791 RepID=UPI0035D9348A
MVGELGWWFFLVMWGNAVLIEGLIAAAAAGGGAVVQAAGTDAWNGIRSGVARLFGRGEAGREQAVLERLDRTQAVLEAAQEGAEAEQVRIAQVAVWQTRLETLLEELPDTERQQVVAELEALVAQADAAQPSETVHNDFRNATFEGPVQGSGTQNNHFHR